MADVVILDVQIAFAHVDDERYFVHIHERRACRPMQDLIRNTIAIGDAIDAGAS
jgi:hypothetical protein